MFYLIDVLKHLIIDLIISIFVYEDRLCSEITFIYFYKTFKNLSFSLRQMQEEEYKEVEKMMKEQEENEKKIEEEQKAKELEEQKQLELRKQQEELEKAQKAQRLQSMPAEPLETEPNIISILFRLPNGSKITRRFRISESIQVISSNR